MGFILSKNDSVATQYTSGGVDCVKAFMSEIGKYSLLTKEEEIELAKLILDGGKKGVRARAKLFNSNLRLVVSVAKRYLNKGLDMEDLIQEGCIGLNKAIDKYDYTRGLKFSTCAVWWVRQGITRALADKAKTVRIPVHMVGIISKYKTLAKDIEMKLGRAATDKEIMMVLKLDNDKLDLIKRSLLPGKSLDEILTGGGADDNTSDLGDTISTEEDVAEELVNADINEELDYEIDATTKIDEKCPVILRLHFGLYTGKPMSQKAICEILGLHSKVVKTLLDKSLAYLKDNLDRNLIYG